jgi:mono/diheme cytochrome c family protein
MRRTLLALTGTALLLTSLPACDVGLPAGRTPHREGNRLDMGDQPKQKPQRGDLFGGWPTGMLEPPPGAVATDEHPYPFTQAQAELAGQELVNPLPASPEVLAHGQFVFENVCIACHGAQGAGDGPVTALFPKPPSLLTQRVRDWPDGQIYHRPARGQGSMPSHSRQVDERDIWSVVHYIRKLQGELPVAPPAPSAAPAEAPAAGTSEVPSPDTAPPDTVPTDPAAKGGRS